ncbi:hypothetical protein F5Y12DRAFT_168449 [Xylaria sp. FL1777]|nr:hypothetical protein F5Y12DRAFT_168449 [Xylaria sp. FL1777]
MSHKQPRQSKPQHHPHRHPRQSRPAVSPHNRRGRSRSRPSRRARSSSVRLHSRHIPQPRVRSHSRSHQPVNSRDIPFYIPSSGQHGNSIPTIIADALRKQSQEHSEALTATNLGYRLPTPPPDYNAAGAAMTPAAPAPGLKRRPSSSPAAANARRRRRRRPRPRQRSVMSDQEEPIPPPRPQPAPFYPPRPASPPYSFFGIIRAKAEKEKRDQEAKKKREKRERRRLKKEAWGKPVDSAKKPDSPKRTKGPGTGGPSKPPSKRASSAPPLSRSPVQEADYYDQTYDEQTLAGSQRGHQTRYKQGKQRHKKHPRRAGEQHHRRQKKRSKYAMRDFFASLRRKLGNLLRFTLPAGSSPGQSAPAHGDAGNSTATREPSSTQYQRGQTKIPSGQPSQQHRGRRRVDSTRQPLPYFMHGGRSPANSWHSRLSRPRSTRRFTATVESAPGSGAPSPHGVTEEFPTVVPAVAGLHPQRFSYHSSASAISIIARRFMGPFFSESSDPSTLDNGFGQRRLSWRSHKLLTAGSKPVTPPSSRNPSPGGRGRSSDRGEGVSVPGAYRSFSSSRMGRRSALASSPDRRSRSVSPCRISSPVASPVASPVVSPASPPDYGLVDLFATPIEVRSPIEGSPTRISSPDSGLQRLFASSPGSSGLNFGLRRLFGD